MLTNWSRMQLNELKASDYYHLHECYHNLVTATTILLCVLVQGQARGYGHITHFLPLPTWGHDFPWAIVTQPMGIFQTPEVFAPCGRHANEVIRPYPQGCP